MDNAGGHGTMVAIEEYKNILLTEFNIKIIHQIPNSPETNLLDLGTWSALQSKTESLSYRQRQDPDVLCDTVLRAWNNLPVHAIGKAYKRWLKVLDLILLDNGGNRYVEQFRGKLTSDPSESTEEVSFSSSESEDDTQLIKEIQAELIEGSLL